MSFGRRPEEKRPRTALPPTQTLGAPSAPGSTPTSPQAVGQVNQMVSQGSSGVDQTPIDLAVNAVVTPQELSAQQTSSIRASQTEDDQTSPFFAALSKRSTLGARSILGVSPR